MKKVAKKNSNKKWRIKKVEYTDFSRSYYILEKRFLGFLWWVDADWADEYAGPYYTLNEARKAYEERKVKAKKSYEYLD